MLVRLTSSLQKSLARNDEATVAYPSQSEIKQEGILHLGLISACKEAFAGMKRFHGSFTVHK